MKKAQRRRSRIRRRQKQKEKTQQRKNNFISFYFILCWLMVKHKFSGFIALVQSTCSVNHISRNRNTFQTNEQRQRQRQRQQERSKIKPQKPTFKRLRHTETESHIINRFTNPKVSLRLLNSLI